MHNKENLQNFKSEVLRRGTRFRFIEKRKPTKPVNHYLGFTKLQAYSTSYAYRLSADKEWLVTPHKIEGIEAEYVFEFGRLDTRNTDFVHEESYSIYYFGRGRHYLALSTPEELSVSIGARGTYRTGYVTKNGYLYVNPVDFYCLGGMSCQEYEERVKHNLPVPNFVMHMKLTKNERYIEFYRDDEKKDLPKFRDLFNLFGNDDIDVEFKVKPIKCSSFLLPKVFTDTCNITGETYLPTEYDEKTGKYRIESPVSVCSCCGKPMRWNGTHDPEIGKACSECADMLPVLNYYVGKETRLPSAQKLERALNTILSDTDKNAKFISDIRNEIIAIKAVIGGENDSLPN